MNRFVSLMTGSIAGRLIVTSSLIILVGCGLSWYAVIRSEREALLKNAVEYTASYSGLIQESIHHDMLSAHRESIQRIIENIGAEKNVRRVRIVDGHGRIVFSSRPSEINGKAGIRPEGRGAASSVRMFQGVSGSDGRWNIHKDREGKNLLAFSAPIYNRPSCANAACHFHHKDEKKLGTLQTEFSLRDVDRSIWTQTSQTTVFAVIFLLLTSAIMFFFVWKFVHQPVSLLMKHMKRIAGGDLCQRVPLTGQDEIGRLAKTFNRMVEALEKTTVSRDSLVTEVEERRRIEERLQKSEQFLNAALDSIHDPFIIVDMDYKTTRANEAYSLLRNIPMQELVGRKCHEIIHQSNRVCRDCTVSRTFLSGDPCASERSVLNNGIETWHQVYTYPMISIDGEVSHVIEYFREITDRKVAEKAAKAAYEELEQIFNTASDGMCVVDRNFIIQRVNRTFLSLFGIKGESVTGRKCHEIFPGPECQTSRCPLALISSGEKLLFQHETEKVRMDGKVFQCLVYATAFRGPDGELAGIIGDFKDITERKRMEDELRNRSLTDELTGLYNRRGLYALAERELKLASRHGKGIYLLYADMDGFKEINDTFGHEEGDKALKDAADVLRQTFRSSDIISRIGGDEFVIVPTGTSGDNIDVIIGRMQANLDLCNSRENSRYRIAISVGVSYYNPEYPVSVDELLTRADECMYDNKRRKKSLLCH